MKRISPLLPATGVAAMVLCATLAGCSSGTKTATTSSATAASSASATSSSASSTAAESTDPESTDTAHYADVTLPDLPGWSDDPNVAWQEGNDYYHVAALKYGETATSIQVLIRRLDPGNDPVEGAKALVAKATDGCELNGDPAPATMSGFNGYSAESSCKSGVQNSELALGINETSSAPPSVVYIAGISTSETAAKVKEALDLIASEGTIVP